MANARCGLCNLTNAESLKKKGYNLIKTECCKQWVCDDEHTYQMFSYARNSCARSHRKYTICGFHFVEGHKGKWQDCMLSFMLIRNLYQMSLFLGDFLKFKAINVKDLFQKLIMLKLPLIHTIFQTKNSK